MPEFLNIELMNWGNFWDLVIRAKRVANFLPLLESLLAGFHSLLPDEKSKQEEDHPLIPALRE